ncbi:22571_t:CDS:2, partial [Dentiscutata erythropus]
MPNMFTTQNIEEIQSDNDYEDNVELILDASHKFESNQEISNTNVLNKTVDLFVGYSFTSWEDIDTIMGIYEVCYFTNHELVKNRFNANEILGPNPSTVHKIVSVDLHYAAQKSLNIVKFGDLPNRLLNFPLKKQLSGDENEKYDVDKENEFNQVKNLLVSRHKGHLATKCYKSATEKKQKPQSKYTCSTCGQSGHNIARCQNH